MRRLTHFLTIAGMMLMFGIIPLFSLSIVGWSVYSIYQADLSAREMRRQNEEITDIEEAEIYLLEQELAEKDYLLTGDPVYLDLHQDFEEITDDFVAKARSIAILDKEEKAVDRLEQLRDEYELTYSQITAAFQAGDKEQAVNLSLTVSNEKLERVHELVEDLIFYNQANMKEELQKTDRQVRSAIFTSVIGLVIFPFLAVLAYLTTSRVTQPFLVLINTVLAIKGGHFRPELLGTLPDRVDGFGMLVRTLAETAQQIKEREANLIGEITALKEQRKESRRQKLVISSGQRFFRQAGEENSND